MIPIIQLFKELKKCWEEKRCAALATIIKVNGSTYRKEGARCLIQVNGKILGIISGGCVESDLLEHARMAVETGTSKFVEYDFRATDDDIWGLNLGCNGALTILIQPFNPKKDPNNSLQLLRFIENYAYCDTPYYLGTVISSQDQEKVPVGKMVKFPKKPYLTDMSKKNCRVVDIIEDVEVELFIEHVTNRQRIFIVGAGEDAKPITKLANFLNWHLGIIDHRESLLNKENFMYVDDFILINREQYGNLQFQKNSAVVVMTHNYELDKVTLKNLLNMNLAYVGQLGPITRTKKMLNEIEKEGGVIHVKQLEKLHSPIGLDIGSETPEEIALCIVSEICAFMNNRNGRSLREKYPNFVQKPETVQI